LDMCTEKIPEEKLIVEIEIPRKVTVFQEGNQIQASGKLGILKKDLSKIPVSVDVSEDRIRITPYGKRKRDIAITNTAKSIINNMIHGVEHGYTYRLKIVFAHFPISVRVKGAEVHIENIFGERAPRIARIVGEKTEVTITNVDVLVKGPSLEDVSQTAANIESSTKIRDKDQRVFLDGLYIYSREKRFS
jgi:large subunit ribosomal protein L6